LLSKLNAFSFFSIVRNCALIASRMQLKGRVGNVSRVWKAKDQRYFVVTWKIDLILYFLAKIPIYVSCNGAASVYASCIVVRESICGKMYIFSSGFIKKGMKSLHREMGKGPLCKIAMVRPPIV
jgi:hypothetical protein